MEIKVTNEKQEIKKKIQRAIQIVNEATQEELDEAGLDRDLKKC